MKGDTLQWGIEQKYSRLWENAQKLREQLCQAIERLPLLEGKENEKTTSTEALRKAFNYYNPLLHLSIADNELENFDKLLDEGYALLDILQSKRMQCALESNVLNTIEKLSPEEVQNFIKEKFPAIPERLVNELLAPALQKCKKQPLQHLSCSSSDTPPSLSSIPICQAIFGKYDMHLLLDAMEKINEYAYCWAEIQRQLDQLQTASKDEQSEHKQTAYKDFFRKFNNLPSPDCLDISTHIYTSGSADPVFLTSAIPYQLECFPGYLKKLDQFSQYLQKRSDGDMNPDDICPNIIDMTIQDGSDSTIFWKAIEKLVQNYDEISETLPELPTTIITENDKGVYNKLKVEYESLNKRTEEEKEQYVREHLQPSTTKRETTLSRLNTALSDSQKMLTTIEQEIPQGHGLAVYPEAETSGMRKLFSSLVQSMKDLFKCFKTKASTCKATLFQPANQDTSETNPPPSSPPNSGYDTPRLHQQCPHR